MNPEQLHVIDRRQEIPVGASVCYVEENDNGFLTSMAADYDMEPYGDGWGWTAYITAPRPPV